MRPKNFVAEPIDFWEIMIDFLHALEYDNNDTQLQGDLE